METDLKLAVLIDGDNIPSVYIGYNVFLLCNQLILKGNIS